MTDTTYLGEYQRYLIGLNSPRDPSYYASALEFCGRLVEDQPAGHGQWIIDLTTKLLAQALPDELYAEAIIRLAQGHARTDEPDHEQHLREMVVPHLTEGITRADAITDWRRDPMLIVEATLELAVVYAILGDAGLANRALAQALAYIQDATLSAEAKERAEANHAYTQETVENAIKGIFREEARRHHRPITRN